MLFQNAYSYVKTCDACQRTGNISRRNEMPLKNIVEVELFDVWGYRFHGLLFIFILQSVYSGSSRLCVKIGKSCCFTFQWCTCGDKILKEKHLYTAWYTKGDH